MPRSQASLISIEDGYARFSPTGFVTHLSLVGLLERAMIECQSRGQTRLLADLRALEHPPLSAVDRYELATAAADMWDRSILLVVLVRSDQLDPERFGQRVAGNRGLFFESFTDEASAKAWIRRPRRAVPD
jgi:hypothetical protein